MQTFLLLLHLSAQLSRQPNRFKQKQKQTNFSKFLTTQSDTAMRSSTWLRASSSGSEEARTARPSRMRFSRTARRRYLHLRRWASPRSPSHGPRRQLISISGIVVVGFACNVLMFLSPSPSLIFCFLCSSFFSFFFFGCNVELRFFEQKWWAYSQIYWNRFLYIEIEFNKLNFCVQKPSLTNSVSVHRTRFPTLSTSTFWVNRVR